MSGTAMEKKSDKQICAAILLLLALYVSQDKIISLVYKLKKTCIIHFLYFLTFIAGTAG